MPDAPQAPLSYHPFRPHPESQTRANPPSSRAFFSRAKRHPILKDLDRHFPPIYFPQIKALRKPFIQAGYKGGSKNLR